MPKVRLTPQEKKRLAYLRDHYYRGGESKIAWRRGKPLKKRKAIHSARRKYKAEIKKLAENDDPELSALRRLTTTKQRKISDWGVLSLREYVERAKEGRRRISGH